MGACWRFVCLGSALLLGAFTLHAQGPAAVASDLNQPDVAGRPVNLDAQGKLLPFPMPDNTGYSYSGDTS